MARLRILSVLLLVVGCGSVTAIDGTGGSGGASASGGAAGSASTGAGGGGNGGSATGGGGGSHAGGSGGGDTGGSAGANAGGGKGGGQAGHDGAGGAAGATATGAGGAAGSKVTGAGGTAGVTVTGAGGALAEVTLTLVVQDDDGCQDAYSASGTATANNMSACTITNATATKFETTCTYKFAPGTAVTVNAQPQGGSRFDGPPAIDCGTGVDDNGDCTTGTCSCTFTITANKTVTASFCHT